MKIASKEALVRRGVQLHSQECSMCFGVVESIDHVLRDCPFARKVWEEISTWCGVVWCGVSVTIGSSLKDNLISIFQVSMFSKLKNVVYSIYLATFWMIWSARNDFTFNARSLEVNKVVEKIKFHTFGWMKNRAKLRDLLWHTWCSFYFTNFPL